MLIDLSAEQIRALLDRLRESPDHQGWPLPEWRALQEAQEILEAAEEDLSEIEDAT